MGSSVSPFCCCVWRFFFVAVVEDFVLDVFGGFFCVCLSSLLSLPLLLSSLSLLLPLLLVLSRRCRFFPFDGVFLVLLFLFFDSLSTVSSTISSSSSVNSSYADDIDDPAALLVVSSALSILYSTTRTTHCLV